MYTFQEKRLMNFHGWMVRLLDVIGNVYRI